MLFTICAPRVEWCVELAERGHRFVVRDRKSLPNFKLLCAVAGLGFSGAEVLKTIRKSSPGIGDRILFAPDGLRHSAVRE